MALQSGPVVVPEKVPVQWFNGHQLQPPHYHQIDERDGLLMWLRGEFAAANAIIDSLCHHLRAVGDPGEYDGVIGSIQQRRCNWNPVLHMQQYFPVAEVVYGLQQVGWRRQQQQKAASGGFEGSARIGGGGKDYRRVGGRVNGNGKDLNNGYVKSYSNVSEKLDGGDKEKEDKKETNEKSESNSIGTRQSAQGIVTHADDKAAVSCRVDGSEIISEKKRNLQVSPRTFVTTEIYEGKSVNTAEGMKLYEDLFDDSEISKLTTLVNELRVAGKRGQLTGQSFVSLKRPMRGHGREIIQLGVPIADACPDDDPTAWTSKELKTEPIPELLQDVIERLLTEKVVTVKPDSAIIDFFNEGDYSQPHVWPQTYGRPVCVLFLAECEMSFGKVVSVDYPGDYRGALQLSLSPGSMLVMQGKSSDIARHALPSLRKQRILVTLVKSQPKKTNAVVDVHRFPSTVPPPSNWAPPPSRSPIQHIRPMAAKHFNPVPPTGGVLPVPPNNAIQPMFVPSPIPPAIAFPAPVPLPPSSAGWPVGPPRQHPPPPRLPVPGTGVFLPSQGSGNSSSAENISVEENGTKKTNEKECNGSTNAKEEERENHDKDDGAVGAV